MQLTYENVGDYLAESECCKEALKYLNKCKDEGKTLDEAYMGIPRIGWFLWLIDHLERELTRGLEIYELYEVLSELGCFIETFKTEYDKAKVEAKADGTDFGYQLESYAFILIQDNYNLSLQRLLTHYRPTIFDAFKEMEPV